MRQRVAAYNPRFVFVTALVCLGPSWTSCALLHGWLHNRTAVGFDAAGTAPAAGSDSINQHTANKPGPMPPAPSPCMPAADTCQRWQIFERLIQTSAAQTHAGCVGASGLLEAAAAESRALILMTHLAWVCFVWEFHLIAIDGVRGHCLWSCLRSSSSPNPLVCAWLCSTVWQLRL